MDEFRLQAQASFDWLEAIVADVDAEQAMWRPPGRANTIAATYAHIVRNVDEDINQRLIPTTDAQRGPWRGRTGLELGRSDFDNGAQTDWLALRAYGQAIGAFVVEVVDAMSPEDLGRIADLSTPDRDVWRGIDIVRLSVSTHVRLRGGEIVCLKGLQGMRGDRSGLDANRP
jgi:hypothetical protein